MLVREDKAWDYAVGMIKVDGLEPTPEMKKLIEREKRDYHGTDKGGFRSEIQDEAVRGMAYA